MTGRPNEATSGKYDGDGMWMPCPLCAAVSACSWAPACSAVAMRTRRPSSSSLYLRCQKSSTECTVGISAKLYSGGGDGIDHSNDRPSHGSAGASTRRFREATQFHMKMSTDTAMTKAPTVDTVFQK